MTDFRPGVDAHLDAEAQPKRRRAPVRRADKDTIDLFTGEPDGRPEKKPTKLSKSERLTLEAIMAAPDQEHTEQALRSSPPPGVSMGAIAAALGGLRRLHFIKFALVKASRYADHQLRLTPTEFGQAHFRTLNEAEARGNLPPVNQGSGKRDAETIDLLAPDRYGWLVGRARWVATQHEEVTAGLVFFDLRRKPVDDAELDAAILAIQRGAEQGWLVLIAGKTASLLGRDFDVYQSRVYSPR